MDLKAKAESLSNIEKETLIALSLEEFKTVQETSKASGLPTDSVRRALEWLAEKELVELTEEKDEQIVLTQIGKSSLSKALPEKLFIEALQQQGGKGTLDKVYKQSQLNRPEFNVAMGIARKNGWISMRQEPPANIVAGVVSNPARQETTIELTGLEKDFLEGNYPLEIALKKIAKKEEFEKDEPGLKEALKRGLAEKAVEKEKKARLKDEGKKALELVANVKKRAYNIHGEVPKIFVGKKQPYVQFLEQIKQKLVNLGFKEMQEKLITQEFYNYDVLFQPQNHPARSWTDTYQLKQPKFGKLPDKKIVERVKAAHETGGSTGSVGWRYKWSEKIASRLMPMAHGTAADARQMVKGIDIPGKYFVINRCYRPDVLDASHLIEFNQLDGFVVGKEMNFRKLLGILKHFAIEIAETERVKFTTGYFPFTEPSCELYVEHPKIGWIEVGGAGIFRPELTLPLGIKQPVIAWGLGVDRLAMIKLGIKDIRKLFSKDLKWLRNAPMIQF